MSELHNPLFDDQREFLERQKEEYKNALLSDFTDLKDQSQKVGKYVLMAGGALAGIFLISKAIGGSREESPRKKRKRLAKAAKFQGAEDRGWISSIPDVEEDEPLFSAIERTYPAVYHPSTGTMATGFAHPEKPSLLKSFLKSDMFKMVEQQLAAIAMVYLTKIINEHLSPGRPIVVESLNADVIEITNEPEQTLDAQPL